MIPITRVLSRVCVLLVLTSAFPACKNSGEQDAARTTTAHAEDVGAPTAPAVADANDWCAEHGLPESMCTKCHPDLIAKFKAAGDWCNEHGYPDSVCPRCNPMTPPAGAPPVSAIAPGTVIRFRSPEIERAAGIRSVAARETAMGVGVECTAQIDFDGNRVADIRAPIAGVVRSVRVDLGAAVATGTTLFVLESPSVGEIQGRLRSARQRAEVARTELARQESLYAAQAVSIREVELARQEMETAHSELTSAEASLRMTGAPSDSQEGRYELRSPLAGVVVRRAGMVGTFATDETSLATVADTRTMWALLDIGEHDVSSVRVGAPVVVHVEASPAVDLQGVITWISSEVDPRTRTVSARAEIPNREGLLRAHQFVRATVQVSRPEGAVAVPRECIQRLGDDTVVFVRTGEGVYEPRLVTGQRSADGFTQVSGDIRAGDAVVTDGAYLLKTELSKESIGAGCCEVGTKKAEH
jgi:cobalt-zinc-cadmium efflux system membrane fusion protein